MYGAETPFYGFSGGVYIIGYGGFVPNFKSRPVMLAVLLGALTLLSSVVLFDRVGKTEFQTDEPGWISSGYYYTNLVFNLDFDRQKWECSECWGFGSLNMHLGKFMIGIPLKLYSSTRGGEFFGIWDVFKSWETNVNEGKFPPQDILLFARQVTAVQGVICILLVFAIGYSSVNWGVGLVASLLLLMNNLFVLQATRAMTDVSYNLFLLCGCWALIPLLRTGKKSRIVLSSAFCGLFAGLATSVKITGIALLGALFLAVLLYAGILQKYRKKEVVLFLAVFAVSALLVVYILNPSFWPALQEINVNALGQELLSLPEKAMKGELQRGGLSKPYPQLFKLYEIVSHSASYALQFPNLFIRWQNNMNIMMLQWGAGWGENRFITFHKNLLSDYGSFPFEWIFLLIGFVSACAKVIVGWRNRFKILQSVPILYFLINYLFILVSMQLNWDRYYLPTVIATKVLVAIGITTVGAMVYSYWSRRKKAVNAAVKAMDVQG